MFRDHQGPISHEKAQATALQALAHIAGDDDLLTGFLGLTGLAAEELRTAATGADSHFLIAVLDYLLSDEQQLLAFCQDANIDPSLPARARGSLPGGEQIHWT